MKVNEVSRQQRLECSSQTSGHSESLLCIRFGDSDFFQRSGPPAGSDLLLPSNRPTRGCQLEDKMLTNSVLLEVHLMLKVTAGFHTAANK